MAVDSRIPVNYKSIDRAKQKRLHGLNHVKYDRYTKGFELHQKICSYFRQQYRINYETIECLTLMYINYHSTKDDLTLSAIHRLLSIGSYQSASLKVNILLNKGFIDCLTSSKRKSYIPSCMAIEVYQKLGIDLKDYSELSQIA